MRDSLTNCVGACDVMLNEKGTTERRRRKKGLTFNPILRPSFLRRSFPMQLFSPKSQPR
jgi:hypothetical protein